MSANERQTAIAHRRLAHLARAFTNAEYPDSLLDITQFRVPPTSDKPHRTELNPVHFLLRSAQVYPTKIAIRHGSRSYTYAEFATRVKNFAWALKRLHHILPHDRVAILAPNAPALLEAHFAIPAARAIIVAINTRLRSEEVGYILTHSGARVLLVDYEYMAAVPVGIKIPVIRIDDSELPTDPYERFLEEGQEGDWWGLEQTRDEEDVIAIGYTSGSTGKPKGVETHYRGAYLAALGNCIESQLSTESQYLWTLPMFHCNGWTFPWAVTAVSATHIMLRKIDYDVVWNLLNDGVTHYNGAPTVQISIVNHPKAKRLNRPVKVGVAGAAPTSTLISQLELLNLYPVHIYGLTEVYGPSVKSHLQLSHAALPPAQRAALIARQGHAYVVSDEVRVVDPATMLDVPLDGHTIGEIVFRGNLVMKGYLDNPQETTKAFAGGWLHSGDLAVRHPDGAVEIKDRNKDVIISGGENVSSIEVEGTISQVEGVMEVAVVATPDEKWGERPVAFVVLKSGYESKVTEKGIVAFCRERMAGFKVGWCEPRFDWRKEG